MSEARPTADDLKAMDSEIARLTIALNESKQRKRWALLAAAGIKVGDRVREIGRGRARTGVVLDAANEWAGTSAKPWVIVQVIRKDGTLSGLQANFYRDWERVEDSATEAA